MTAEPRRAVYDCNIPKEIAVTIHLSLPPETEADLRERAAAVGKDLASFVREAVEEKLAAAESGRSTLSTEQRVGEWLRWTASHRPLGYVVDDSRESIYAGRGE